MAASKLMTESKPRPGSCTRKGTCLTQGSQVESRPSSASTAPTSSSSERTKERSCCTRSFSEDERSNESHHSRLVSSKGLTRRQGEVVPMQDRMQAIADLRSLVD